MKRITSIITLTLWLLVTSCGPNSAALLADRVKSPTPTSTSTPTATLTSTPLGPTSTPTPTDTPTAVQTPAPTITQTLGARITGGGNIDTDSGRVTFGFELHCDASLEPNHLEVNWGKGEKFHLEDLTEASCSDDPAITPNPPDASFDTYEGAGTGRYDGVSGASAAWTFTDAGEPGAGDFVELTIRDASGNLVLSISGYLTGGNYQSHGGSGEEMTTEEPGQPPKPTKTPKPTHTPRPTHTP